MENPKFVPTKFHPTKDRLKPSVPSVGRPGNAASIPQGSACNTRSLVGAVGRHVASTPQGSVCN